MITKKFAVVLILIMAGIANAQWYTPGANGEILGVAVTASSEMDGYFAVYIVNGNGLGTFGVNTHHIDPYYWPTMWLTEDTDPAAAWLEFDLGGQYDLTNVNIWNYNQRVDNSDALPADWTKGRGVKDMDILVAGADHVFSQFSNVTLNIGGGGQPIFDIVPLVADSVKYVKFEINSNLASDYPEISQDYAGLSEVQFFGPRSPCSFGASDGDTNGDCIINLVDFAVVAANWLDCGWDNISCQ